MLGWASRPKEPLGWGIVGVVVPESGTGKGRGKRMQARLKPNHGGVASAAGRALAALVTLLVLGGALAGPAGANFVLWNDEQLTVDSFHAEGTLNDHSRAEIVSGGFVDDLYAYNFSTLDVSGGDVGKLYGWGSITINVRGGYLGNLYACGSSPVDISGGNVHSLETYNSSTTSISSGVIDSIYATNDSTVDISGGSVSRLYATDSSMLTFHGRDFQLSGGLSLDGDRVLGTGYLAGLWFDGTPWVTEIWGHSGDSVIRIIPEPATLALLGVGLAGLLRRRRTPCPVGGRR